MDGKIGLEEHFAIEETLADLRGFLIDETWPQLRGNLLDFQRDRIALMDEHGIEMMILSLNAPAVQAIPDPAQANEVARAPTISWPSRLPAGPTASRRSPRCRCRTPRWRRANGALRQGARLLRRARQRLFADRRSRHHRLLRPAAILAVLGRGGAARRAVLPASAQPAAAGCAIYKGHNWLLGPIWAFGQSRPPCTRCA